MLKFLLFILALSFFSSGRPLGFAKPEGIYDRLIKVVDDKKREETIFQTKVASSGIDKSVNDKLNHLNSVINSTDGCVVAIKFTSKNELGRKELIKEIDLSVDLKNKARFFTVDYSAFLDFLHSQIYGKFKISKLDIPSILFFRSGKLILPIEPWDFSLRKSSTEKLEALIRDRIKNVEDEDDVLSEIRLSALENQLN